MGQQPYDDERDDPRELLSIGALALAVLALTIALVTISGPTGLALGLLSLVVSGLALYDADTGQGTRLAQVSLGLSGAALLLGLVVLL